MIDRLAMVNVFLVLFNLIPAFPMDGGRVLRALLATRMGYVRATEVAAYIGQGFAFALGFIGLFSNFMLLFIAIFVYLAASSEAHFVAMRSMARGVPVSAAMMTQYRDAHSATPTSRMRCRALLRHQPERIPGGRRARQAGRPAQPQRHHPRAQGARARRPRRRGDDDGHSDHQLSPAAGRRIQAPAGEVGARGGGRSMPADGLSGSSPRKPSAR